VPWLEHAEIAEGPIFRRLIGRNEIGDGLHPGSIAPIFKRVAQWIGMPARFVAEVSGHSTRVGAAEDLAEARHRLGGDYAGRRVEVNADAAERNMRRKLMRQGREWPRAAAAAGRDAVVSNLKLPRDFTG
jgi:hypothetical protein